MVFLRWAQNDIKFWPLKSQGQGQQKWLQFIKLINTYLQVGKSYQ